MLSTLAQPRAQVQTNFEKYPNKSRVCWGKACCKTALLLRRRRRLPFRDGRRLAQSHRLLAPIRQRTPDPFHRAVAEMPQPKRADDEQQRPDGEDDVKQLIAL